MKASPAIAWFRLDLRLADNPALHAAIKRRGAVIPVFIHAPEEETPWQPGAASRWWAHQSLRALDSRLRELGSRLIIRRGPALQTLRALVTETGAGAIFWNRRYEPELMARDAQVEQGLAREGHDVESFNAALLHEPWRIQNRSGRPFQVFTPYWKHCLAQPAPARPLAAPKQLPRPLKWPRSVPLDHLDLEAKMDWTDGLRGAWSPGEAGARAALSRFLAKGFANYSESRDRPDLVGTSRLSPHLHFGEISPRQVWHGLAQLASKQGMPDGQWRGSRFLAEIGWREFSHHLLFHFPRTPEQPLRADFKLFPWRQNAEGLRAWRQGRTGYPVVDAGMRELWSTGWMHNRLRMITASFLVKDLLLPWQEGARWFWDTLVDADLAQNTLGWQWIAGCGADAAPYFRIFNPTSQGEKFDPQGDYVRKWCPELAQLPDQWLHRPDQAPPDILRAAGVRLGQSYPKPIVSHATARKAALEAHARMKDALRANRDSTP